MVLDSTLSAVRQRGRFQLASPSVPSWTSNSTFWPSCRLLKAGRLDRREAHEYIFAALPADKAVAFGVVNHSTVARSLLLVFLAIDLRWREVEVIPGRHWLHKRELPHRFGSSACS